MMRIASACVVALAMGLATPASAAIMMATYTGTVARGYDSAGIFGAPGPAVPYPRTGGNLDGLPYVATYKYDTSLGVRNTTPGWEQVHGGYSFPGSPVSPVLDATLSIGGNTFHFDADFSGAIRTGNSCCSPNLVNAYALSEGPHFTDMTFGFDPGVAVPNRVDQPFSISFASTLAGSARNFTNGTDPFDFEMDLNATSLDVRPLSAVSEYDVRLLPSGQEMAASFTAPGGMTLSEFAASNGFDHFNWHQVATNFPGVETPFVDPVPGGWLGRPADNLEFYWDEEIPDGIPHLSGYQLSENIINEGRTLVFSDAPADSYITALGGYMEFSTALAGVRSDGSWQPLYAWRWKSDTRPLFPGGEAVVLRNITPLSDATGGVFDVQDFQDPALASYEVRRLWVEHGATGISVPEPDTWLLLLAGFGGIGALLRRKPNHLGFSARSAGQPSPNNPECNRRNDQHGPSGGRLTYA